MNSRVLFDEQFEEIATPSIRRSFVGRRENACTFAVAYHYGIYRRSRPLHCGISVSSMSALGHSQPTRSEPREHVCPLLSKSGQPAEGLGMSAWCQLRLNALQQRQRYSIASLARTRIALAVFNGVRYALRRIRDARVAAIVWVDSRNTSLASTLRPTRSIGSITIRPIG